VPRERVRKSLEVSYRNQLVLDVPSLRLCGQHQPDARAVELVLPRAWIERGPLQRPETAVEAAEGHVHCGFEA